MSKEKLLLLSLAAVQFTNVMDFMIMMPLGPQLMRIFDINPQQFSLLVSAYTLSAGIFGFLSAFFIDKFDRKTALLTMYIGFTIGTCVCGLAPTYITLLMARVLTGVFGGVLGALVMSIIGDAIPLERRATAVGAVMASFSFASVVGVPFGLYLATTFTWQMPFLLLGGMGLLVLVLIYFYVPSMRLHLGKKDKNENPFLFLTHIFSNKNQVMALLLTMFMILGQFSYISLLSPFMVSNVGFTEHELTYIYLLGGGATIVTSPLIGRLADKYGKVQIFTICTVLAMIPLLALTHIGVTAVYIVLMITTFNFIFIAGRMIAGSTMVTAAVLPQNRGSFMSINSSVQQISSGLGAFVAGLMVTKSATGHIENYNYVGYLALICSIIALYLANTLKPVEKSVAPMAPENV